MSKESDQAAGRLGHHTGAQSSVLLSLASYVQGYAEMEQRQNGTFG